MKNITKIKSVYKTIVNTFLKTEDVSVYWEYAKALNDFVELFPEIDFKTLIEEIRKELFEKDKFINNYNENNNNNNNNMDNQEKEEITYEDFVEKYCNNECRMKKCEGIGTTWSVYCPYQSQVKILH